MINRELNYQLDRVDKRLRMYRFWSGLGIVLISTAVLTGLIYAYQRGTGNPIEGGLQLTLGVAFLGSIFVIAASFFTRREQHRLAQKIEARYPQLDSVLVTALDQQPDKSTGHWGYLQQSVVDKAVHHALVHDWRSLVSSKQMGFARFSAVAGIVFLIIGTLGLNSLPANRIPEKAMPERSFDDVEIGNPEYDVTIEPGDTEVEQGTSLLVLARFDDRLPPEATLVYTTEDGLEHTVSMSRSLDDPLFGGRIESVESRLKYRVEIGTQRSSDFQVDVFTYPLLLQTDARLLFPEYTNQEEKLVQDVRRVSAVEGTKLTLMCRVNKALATAQFLEVSEEQKEKISLRPSDSDSSIYETTFFIDRSRELELHLTDEDGRTNRHPPKFRITMIENLPPDIKLIKPTRDIEVSPIEEVEMAASAWDDFGLQQVGLSYSIPGRFEKEISLGDTFPAKERIEVEHLLAFEDLDAEPDELLTWYFWAEDIGPDGEVRRVSSDLFFAEVRPFEEIFRQGQQPEESSQQQQQQSGQNAQQAEELAELQKQIINATWKVIRRETRNEPTVQFEADMQLIVESQQSALTQVQELEQNLEDAESLAHVERVKQEMLKAIQSLETAAKESSISQLQPALGHEQAAYQALLRLRAREHEVVQSSQSQQSGQSQQSQNSRSQLQLNQLQLREDENRYAQQEQAQTEQEQQASEDRQVLNRLKELAERQGDLNEQIKEVQAALEEAKTEEERAEAERQLKRLREEQEELLRDTEELQERMDQPQNQERMAEAQQQLDEARENIRQSAESLQQEMLSQAANQGTRAQRGLDDLKEEFQKRTAGEFEEELQDIQQQAQKLVEEENKLAEKLEKLRSGEDPASNSLRDSGEKQASEQQLAEQKERLKNLLEKMRETIEQAEESQPLLAEELYETIRDTRKADPEKALEATDLSLQRGLIDYAIEQESLARESMQGLAEGIEKAAEKVLGDEVESLRRALSELEQLNEDLEGELARAAERDFDPQDGRNTSGDNRSGDEREMSNAEGTSSEGQAPTKEQQNEQDSSTQQPGQQGKPSDQSGKPGGSEADPESQQPGQTPGQQQTPGQSNSSGQSGQPQQYQPSGEQQSSPGNSQSEGDSKAMNFEPGGIQQFLNNGGGAPSSPFSGENFVEWSDRLRDVEEIVDDPDLQAEAARIRDEAREIRKEILNTSAPPQWDLIKQKIAQPLTELQNRVAEELLKRTAEDAQVPIDKDPVPTEYEAEVRRYYQRLGSGE
ncbi:hypothetical protein [uncultured Rubinisphaera sp.]|uniref:hypothetical protein n=1 Tax=uncultured Rubinisphaera sp. TaxID=1678686 RepID=UPI0030DDA75A